MQPIDRSSRIRVVLLVTAAVGVVIGWLVLYRARRTGRRNQRDSDA